MPQGDPGGNFAGTGGYGGNSPGYGGASNQSGSGGYGGTTGWGTQFGPGGFTAGLTGAGGLNPNGLGNGSMYGSPNLASFGTGWPAMGVAGFQPGPKQRAAQAAQAPKRQPFSGAGPTPTSPTVTAPVTPRPKPPIDPVTGLPQFTPEDLPQDYNTHIPGTPITTPTYQNPNWPNINQSPDWEPIHGGWNPPNNDFGGFQEGGFAGSFGGFTNDMGNIGNPQVQGPNNRQFGGPVAPGGQYTVGENGPETLRMGPNGGGQVIPHNPMDRLGSMNPQMMQQMFQLMRQQKKMAPAQQGMQPPPMPVRNPTPPMAAPPQPPPGGGFQGRPPVQGGFGLSHLGQPGVLGQIRQRIG
jgi:hypothetical protein